MIIGIDLGGMSAKGAVLKDGELLGKTRVKTSADRSAQETAFELSRLAMEVAEKAGVGFDKVQAIGIGSPGVIDSKTGTVVNWTNFNWKDVPLATYIRERTGKQVFVTNDANAAALGEAKYGAGKNYSDSVLITIGTGVGGGIILGGKLFEGYRSAGAEIGHMVIRQNGKLCSCGRRGCYEVYASARALIEITRDILAKKDEDGKYVLDYILDTAGQKGTGKWTAIAALDNGVPLTLIGEAVFARCLSAQKEERVAASKILQGPSPARFTGDRKAFLEDLHKALFASKVVSYAQGYTLMRAAAKEYGWNLNYGGIALMWRGGCIIRSVFLGKIKEAFDKNPDIANILLDPYFCGKLAEAQQGWRNVVAQAIMNGVPAPTLSSALEYYDGYRSERLPANMLQAQRDYFGAHTYERTDRPRGEFFHTNWTGEETPFRKHGRTGIYSA